MSKSETLRNKNNSEMSIYIDYSSYKDEQTKFLGKDLD